MILNRKIFLIFLKLNLIKQILINKSKTFKILNLIKIKNKIKMIHWKITNLKQTKTVPIIILIGKNNDKIMIIILIYHNNSHNTNNNFKIHFNNLSNNINFKIIILITKI